MTSAFKAFEHDAWQNAVDEYDAAFARLTEQAIPSILIVLGVKSGTALLDIACGPGYLAAAGQQSGARAVGTDFSARMVARARKLYPSIQFDEGDAETLENYPDNSFDVAAMNFGMLHFDQPEKALRAAHRVLKPAGRMAFTVWSTPARVAGFSIALKAIEAFGDPSVRLPAGPPFFHFSEPDNCIDAFRRCGFTDVATKTVDQTWELNSPEDYFEALLKGTARTGGTLKRQPPANLAAIRDNIVRAANDYLDAGKIRLPMPAHLAWATKP
ncbi:class I SAM-dependent methyltransferase [Tardiphaga sp. 839_C3_N1_4]|jgi:SAM-dependent methyltransferase|uniref:class I SAM-dependent methyltransferase n=1 Tax=Tardiphaga sp. 839_C3_N1_4 TaxID=3240761 RepID=UPI003F269B0B